MRVLIVCLHTLQVVLEKNPLGLEGTMKISLGPAPKKAAKKHPRDTSSQLNSNETDMGEAPSGIWEKKQQSVGNLFFLELFRTETSQCCR